MSWQRLDLSAPEYERPTEPPITCGLLYRGKRHAISGPPEATKTLVACIFGLEHMRAGHGPFALIDFEMGEHATRLLLHELGATIEEIAAVYYVTPEGPPVEADIEAIVAAGVTLVAIDAAAGAYDVSGLDDNKRADAEMFARAWVRPLWQRNITTVLLDHVVKNSDNRGRYAIGSERKLGAVDVHLGLEAVKSLHRGADGIVKITTHKDRPGHLQRPHPAELHLSSDPETHEITWEFKAPSDVTPGGGGFRPTTLMAKVSRFLEEQTEPLARGEIVRGVKGQRVYVLQAIDELIAGGYATETIGPRRAKLTSHHHPFSESFSPVGRENDRTGQEDAFSGTTQNGSRTQNDSGEEGDAEVARLLAKYGEQT